MRRRANLSRFRCAGGQALLCLLLMLNAFGCKQKEQAPESEETPTETSVEERTETANAEGVPAEPAGEVFEMKEVSVFDLDTPSATQLQRGQLVRVCGIEPSKKVTAYPPFRSKKPFYGEVFFDTSMIWYGVGIDYYFALDESGGTGKGHDRLYFDANRDLDLTNDGVLSPMETPPAELASPSRPGQRVTVFDYLEFDLDRGPDKSPMPLAVIPRLEMWSTSPMASFALPTVRRGKIKLGSQEFDAVLGQAFTITGSYARPMASLHLANTRRDLPFLCGGQKVGGTFYTFSSTPSGDRLTVTPYAGPFGVLEIRTGGPDTGIAQIERGCLAGDDGMINIEDCAVVDGQLRVPVGDYSPVSLGLRLGDLSVRLTMTTPKVEETPTYAAKIRQDKPCVLNLAGKPDVVFKSPALGERFKVGSRIKVEAAVHDPVVDASLRVIDDTTRKIGSIKLSDGTRLPRFQSVDPIVEITNSSGERVAGGKMPFG